MASSTSHYSSKSSDRDPTHKVHAHKDRAHRDRAPKDRVISLYSSSEVPEDHDEEKDNESWNRGENSIVTAGLFGSFNASTAMEQPLISPIASPAHNTTIIIEGGAPLSSTPSSNPFTFKKAVFYTIGGAAGIAAIGIMVFNTMSEQADGFRVAGSYIPPVPIPGDYFKCIPNNSLVQTSVIGGMFIFAIQWDVKNALHFLQDVYPALKHRRLPVDWREKWSKRKEFLEQKHDPKSRFYTPGNLNKVVLACTFVSLVSLVNECISTLSINGDSTDDAKPEQTQHLADWIDSLLTYSPDFNQLAAYAGPVFFTMSEPYRFFESVINYLCGTRLMEVMDDRGEKIKVPYPASYLWFTLVFRLIGMAANALFVLGAFKKEVPLDTNEKIVASLLCLQSWRSLTYLGADGEYFLQAVSTFFNALSDLRKRPPHLSELLGFISAFSLAGIISALSQKLMQNYFDTFDTSEAVHSYLLDNVAFVNGLIALSVYTYAFYGPFTSVFSLPSTLYQCLTCCSKESSPEEQKTQSPGVLKKAFNSIANAFRSLCGGRPESKETERSSVVMTESAEYQISKNTIARIPISKGTTASLLTEERITYGSASSTTPETKYDRTPAGGVGTFTASQASIPGRRSAIPTPRFSRPSSMPPLTTTSSSLFSATAGSSSSSADQGSFVDLSDASGMGFYPLAPALSSSSSRS